MTSKDDEKNEAGPVNSAPEKFSYSTEVLKEHKSSKDSKFSDDDDEDVLCGLGPWKPEWIQRAANPKFFMFFHTMAGLAQGATFTYFIACTSTLEKRYGYDTKKTGYVILSDEITPILFGILIGYFGGLTNRPKFLTAGMFLGTISCFIMASPYFLYGSLNSDERLQRLENRTADEDAQFCMKDGNQVEENCNSLPGITVVSILMLGNFLKGISSEIFYIIGTTYMDDSVKKKNTPVYLATIFTLRLVGPMVGFLLSSLCLEFYEDPFYDPGYDTKDPRWIGAWWIGFIVLGVLIFIFSAPMILFPQRFPQRKYSSSLQKKEQEHSKSPIDQFKGLGKALKRLVTNPLLICNYLGGVFRLNGIVGYYFLLPKYMEMQFRQSASKASLYSGPASLIGMMVGILIGGIAIRKFRPRPRVMTGGLVIVEFFIVISLIICMFITCPVDQMAGTSSAANPLFNLQNECNLDCKCTTKEYTPICGPDGKMSYFSPCFAGCSGYNKTGEKEMFTDCNCVHNEEGEFTLGDANKGYCDFECQWMVTFVVILTLGKLVSSTARVGDFLITLRCVDPADKSVALGTLSGAFSLLAFIPYPLIYGALSDASCLVWEESCGKTGNCWVYDTDKFRFLLHSVSAVFVFLGCVTDMFVCYLSPRLQNLYDEDDDEKEKTDKETADEDVH